MTVPSYRSNANPAFTVWENGAWVVFIGPTENDNYTPPLGGDNGGNSLNGIDNFAWTCRHEHRHLETLSAWYPNGYNAAIDLDADAIPDAQEAALGGTQQNPLNGGPFTPGVLDSDADGWRDVENYTIATQTPWIEGSADSEDWSNPGHQSSQ